MGRENNLMLRRNYMPFDITSKDRKYSKEEGSPVPDDNWVDLRTFVCNTCMYFVEKSDNVGRCRRRAPTMKGFPAVYPTDWCGDHKLGRRRA
jgi:hypothetical protein